MSKLTAKQIAIVRKLENVEDNAFIVWENGAYYLVSENETKTERLQNRTVAALGKARAIWQGIDGKYVAYPAEYVEVIVGNIKAFCQDWEGAKWIIEDRTRGFVGRIEILKVESARYVDLTNKGGYRRRYRTTLKVIVTVGANMKISRELITDKRGKAAIKETIVYWNDALDMARWIAQKRAERNGATSLEIERANAKAFDGRDGAQYRALAALAELAG